MTKRARILLGVILLTLMSANFAANIYSMLTPPKPPEGSDDGMRVSWDYRGEPRVTRVDADGPATDFKVGDEIIAINGVKFRDDPRVLIDAGPVPPGTRFTYTIRRAGELRDLSLQTIPYKPVPQKNRTRIDDWIYLFVILHLLTAWLVILFRPDDKQAWVLALMLGTMTGLEGLNPSNLPRGLNLIVGLAVALGNQFYPLFVHFFLLFPERSKLLRRWPRLETWLYPPILLALLPAFASPRISMDFLLWFGRFPWTSKLVDTAWAIDVAYLAAGLICLAINYRAAGVNDRRRLRAVMAGSAAGFFSLFLLVIGQTGLQARFPTLWSWFYKAVIFTFPLIPVSFVYAIVRHKVIPISLIIRRGLRYLLVSRGSVLLLMVVVSMTLYFAMDTFFYWNPMTGRSVGIISAIVAIAVWQLARTFHLRVVAPKIDRLFFRQSYDAHQIIAELTRSLRGVTDLPRLLELVATKLRTALQTEYVTIYLRDSATGSFNNAYSCDYGGANDASGAGLRGDQLARYAMMVDHLDQLEKSLGESEPRGHDRRADEIELDAFLSGHDGDTPAEKRDALREAKAALLMPLYSKDGMLGVISLGSRLGDLPFLREDKQLLMSVSGPTALAIENARLVERMVEEARRRQEIEAENDQRAKELEEARQLQLSMLPKIIPQLQHLEIAVYMKPAAEVGGDYYDFHQSDNGTLTVVVGDATGHGLKAGTVVTAMKSLFRTFAAEPEIVPIFNRSSRVLKEMNLRSLFMGLTMIKLNGRRMKIASAGMPPALIYRAETGSVEEVMIKAMPLGSVTGYSYSERELTLDCGDVVVLMSDGLPERFNHAGEMFDYSRTMETLTRAAALAPREIIERLVDAGEAWAKGRPQDDDVTFVVLKVK